MMGNEYGLTTNYMCTEGRLQQVWIRSVDSMADIRLIFGRPEHRCQASSAVKMQTGG